MEEEIGEKYSFIDIFKNGKIDKIVIPKLQRDYVQGREDDETNRKRERFLKALKEAINGEPLILDFIYGDVDKKGIMQPLDGQQRLTTLFLLHWYAARKEGISEEKCSCLTKFTYDTRPSSREFCKELIKFNPVFDSDKISEEIMDQEWFANSWLYDPTVKSMLNMLNELEEKFSESNDIWKKLEDGKITFYFLPIKRINLTDDIYIKMNSRGRSLTDFENLKAELEHYMKMINSDRTGNIMKKFDNKWSDFLWTYRDSNNNIDQFFINYFKYICNIIYYKNDDTLFGKELDELELVRKLFSNENSNANENIKTLEEYFDCFCSFEEKCRLKSLFEEFISPFKHENNKITLKEKLEDNEDNSVDIFKAMIHNKSRYPILLYAFTVYLLNNKDNEKISKEQFIRRIRIINNLYNNSSDEISDSDKRSGGNRMPAIIRQIDNIIENGKIELNKSEALEINFNKIQLEEEKEKLKWTEANPDKAEKLYELEDCEYLYGQISIIGTENYELFDKFLELMKCNLDKVNCALLVTGDYYQKNRTKPYYYFGTAYKKQGWKLLFHKSNAIENFEKTKGIIIKLLEKAYNDNQEINDEFLDAIIEKYKKDCEEKKTYTWKYYYIKYDAFRPEDSYGLYQWEDENKKYEILVIRNEKKKTPKKSYQPFLKAIEDNEYKLTKNDYGSKLKSDSYSITMNNDSYIIRDINTEENIDTILIEQNEEKVDIKDRVEEMKQKMKKYKKCN